MNSGVHVQVGVGVTLTLMQVRDLTDLALCVGVASIAATISDIDANGDSKAKQNFRKGIAILVCAGAGLFFANYKLGMQFDVSKLIPLLVFVALCGIGYTRPHREFTHSLFVAVLFSIPVAFMITPRYGICFWIAMASHCLLDLLNKKGVHLLYPVKGAWCLNVCKASSKLSTVLGTIGTLLIYINVYKYLGGFFK